MTFRKRTTWLHSGGFLARLFSALRDDVARPMPGLFHYDSAEIWRRGQLRRSQYLAALVNRRSNVAAEDEVDCPGGRSHLDAVDPKLGTLLPGDVKSPVGRFCCKSGWRFLRGMIRFP